LCNRECVRINSLEKDHALVRLMKESTGDGLRFCPLEYIKVMSKELDRSIQGCTIAPQGNVLSDVIHGQTLCTCISVCEVCRSDHGNCVSGVVQHNHNINKFIQEHVLLRCCNNDEARTVMSC